MKLIKSFEKLRNKQFEVIELTCDINRKEDIDDTTYDDFKANLFINGRFVADISPVLDAAGVLKTMIDEVDWQLEYLELMNDLKHSD